MQNIFLMKNYGWLLGSGKGSNVYNVTNTIPLTSGYYTLATAIAGAEGKGVNKDGKGIVLTYAVNDSKWESFHSTGTQQTVLHGIRFPYGKSFWRSRKCKTISVNNGEASFPDSEGNANIIIHNRN